METKNDQQAQIELATTLLRMARTQAETKNDARIEEYAQLLNRIKTRVGDHAAALQILHEIAADKRTEAQTPAKREHGKLPSQSQLDRDQ